MKYSAYGTLGLSVIVLFGAMTVATIIDPNTLLLTADANAAEAPDKENSGGPPPLVIDRNAPLLLEELPDGPSNSKSKKILADNSACHVCHTNYETEELAVVHAQDDLGCVDCHGKSYDHRNDEDNVTPPDIMFAQDQIDAGCGECHETHDAPARKVVARWQERCPAKTDPRQLVCTDCHGQHRLAFRTVVWDKKTRKLILAKPVQTEKVLQEGNEPGRSESTPQPPDSAYLTGGKG
jgi:hypothetical protein